MAAAAAGPDGVGILGGGLAGSLLALALRERGVAVRLIDAGGPCATSHSYGVIPGWPLDPSPLARRAAGAGRRWRQLQRRHGDLGWRPRRPWPLPLPLSQVDTARLAERLPAVLAAAGVERQPGRVQGLEAIPGGWRLALAGGGAVEVGPLVLAAGAGCRALRADLPAVLGVSWAGVLELPPPAPGGAYPLRLPTRFQRLALEARAAKLRRPEWVVDAGLVPWGEGGLLGQLSWLAPAAPEAPTPAGPSAQAGAGWLRSALAGAAPAPLAALAGGAGRYRQLPVAFCQDGLPLAGPLEGAPGLWLFSGFRGGFAQVPVLAPLLAAAIAGGPGEPAAALAELGGLGVLPALRGRD